MRKFAFALAALGAMAVALPSIASAETVVIKRGGGHHHGWYGARAQIHHDRGWHRAGATTKRPRRDDQEGYHVTDGRHSKMAPLARSHFCCLYGV